MSGPRGDFCKSKIAKGCKEMEDVSTNVFTRIRCKKYDEILEGDILVWKCMSCKNGFPRVTTCTTALK